MRICFVQPNNNYQVERNRIALALTFPQIICNLGISDDYLIYIDGKTPVPFDFFIVNHSVTHVFISSITSTFPRAVVLASIAKKKGCITVLGGVFASSNSVVISLNYTCFDYIVVGKACKDVITAIEKGNNIGKPCILRYDQNDDYSKPLSPIMLSQNFTSVFDASDVVCYELGNGCMYNCSFCTLRKAFGCQFRAREKQIIKEDLDNLYTRWKRLKLIDDDISLSLETLALLEVPGFSEIVVETRLDHINEKFITICKEKGVTHIITGVETFNELSLRAINKNSGTNWYANTQRVIELCYKFGIVLRPVLMLNPPESSIDDLYRIVEYTHNWTPANKVELLMSFYTPHPGLKAPEGFIITNDLSLYDHLHLVFIPKSLLDIDPGLILSLYETLSQQTQSEYYNPPIEISTKMVDEYRPFFNY